MKTFAILSLSLASCYLPPPATALTNKQIFEKLSLASVIVRTNHPEKEAAGHPIAQGSGTVIGRKNGFLIILTAAHLFGKVIDVTVVCGISDGGEGPDVLAAVEAVDHESDLALLIAPDNAELAREPIGVATKQPERFATLYEMASPDEMLHTASTAILTRRTLRGGRYALYGFAWMGASGGTLANERAELVGVVVGVTAVGEGEHKVIVPNVWYAVSLDLVREFLNKNKL